MAKNIHFEIKGIKEVTNTLSKLPKALSDKVLLDINRDAGKIVKKELEAAAPESETTNKASKDKMNSNVIIKKSGSKTGVLVGFKKRAWYVILLEYGTKIRKLTGKGKYRKGTNRGRMERKPFVAKAHQNAYPKAVEHFVSYPPGQLR